MSTLEHENIVTMFALSEKGELIATGDSQGDVRIWHYSAGRKSEPTLLKGHTERITSMAFSQNSTWLVTGSRDNTVRLWSTIKPQKQQNKLEGLEDKSELNVSKNLLTVFQGHNRDIRSVAFNHNNSQIVSSDWEGWIRIWNSYSPWELDAYRSKESVSRAIFSTDNKRILMSMISGVVQQRRLGLAIPEMVWKSEAYPYKIESLVLSRDGKVLTYGKLNWDQEISDIKSCNSDTGQMLENIEPARAQFQFKIADNKSGVLLRSNANTDIKTRNSDGRKEIQFSDKGIKSFVTNADGSFVVSALADGSIYLWNNQQNSITTLQKAEPIQTASRGFFTLSGDGKHIALATQDGKVTLFNSTAIKDKANAIFNTKNITVTALGLNKNGSDLALGYRSGNVQLFNKGAIGGKTLPKSHDGEVTAALFSTDKRRLASLGNDGSIFLWDLQNTEKYPLILVKDTDGIYAMAFSPNGNHLAFARYNKVCVSDVSTGVELRCYSTQPSDIDSISYSPDGKKIAWSSDNKIFIWDYLSEPTPTIILEDHENNVHGIAFNPDDNTQIASFDSDSIQIWSIENKKVTNVLQNCTLEIEASPIDQSTQIAQRILKFKAEFELKPQVCAVLIVQASDKTETNLFVAGFNDKGKFKKVVIHKMNDDLVKEISSPKNNNKIIQLATARIGRTLSQTEAIFFSSDGSSIISARSDNSVQKWFLKTDKTDVLYQHSGAKKSLGVNAEGNRVVLKYKNGATWMLDSSTGKQLYQLNNNIRVLAFNKDGTQLVTSNDQGIRIRNAQNGAEIASYTEFTETNKISSLLYDQERGRIIAGNSDGTIDIWSRYNDKLKKYRLLGLKQYKSLAFANNDEHIYFKVSENRWLALNLHTGLIDYASNKVNVNKPSKCNKDSLRCLSGAGSRDLNLVDSTEKPIVSVINAHKTEIMSTQFLDNGLGTVLTADKRGGIILWELDDDEFRQLAYYQVPGSTLSYVVASHNGRYIAALNNKGEFYLYKAPIYRTWEGLKSYARTVVKGQRLTKRQKKAFHIHDEETE